MIDHVEVIAEVTAVIQKIYTDYRFGKLQVHWMSDDELLEVNRTHLNHDYYTDIITFDYSRRNRISGELFISTDRIKDNATTLGVSELNETRRVVAHGILHLIGFGDKTEAEAAEMRAKENEVLANL